MTYYIDKLGRKWNWNCGWRLHILIKGEFSPVGKSLGHLEFNNRMTPLAPITDHRDKEILHGMDRPNRMWRRLISAPAYDHFLYGNVKLLATDGEHCIVETRLHGPRVHCSFQNLTEVIPNKGPGAKRKTVKKVAKTPSKKVISTASILEGLL